ncbi:MAG: hypothetical protein WDZ49_16850 [Litorilinea sp.]
MQQDGPFMAQQAASWFTQLAGTARPADYFLHPLAFPMLLLPWCMEQTLRDAPDADFQANLIYSSINGYYFIRMIDNVMDGHGETERQQLPMLGVFHSQFHAVYQQYFESQHPFWGHFHQIGIQSAESALRDAALSDIDSNAFATIAGRKVIGGKIPLAAVAYRYQRPDLFQKWQPFYDQLGCWHQMYNDLFGWIKDLQNETPTYFLCEGRRRKPPAQSMAAWVIHEGFDWGMQYLENGMGELLDLAQQLHSRELVDYLHTRRRLMVSQTAQITRAFQSLEPLLDAQL